MASPVEATLLLADSAVADPTGKVHMLGAGWSLTSTPTAPHAVVALVRVPWDRANQRIPFRLELLDSDGRPVTVSDRDGAPSPVSTGDQQLEVGRPVGVDPGSPLDWPIVMNLGPLTLLPGRYEWRLTIAEQEFATPFQVRS